MQFTLFSQTGEPLNERVVFIQNNDRLDLQLKADKKTYAPGEKVKIDLLAADAAGKRTKGNFSISVIDESRVPVNENAESTIFTDLLLKSELAGYIRDPNYYFINPNEQTQADLDLLMLTQGYHRYEWKKILSGSNTPVAYAPEKGFSISGTVTSQGGKPIANGPVFLTSTKHMLVMNTMTDASGKFTFNNLDFADTAKIVINAKKANGGGNVVLKIDKQQYAAITHAENGGYSSDHVTLTTSQVKQAYAAWRQDSLSHTIELKEVKITDHKVQAIRPDYAVLLKHSENLNGPGQADQVILSDQLNTCANIADCLVYLARGGVRIVYPGPVFYSTHTPLELNGPTKPMAVLLNGVIDDQSSLTSISPSDVQSIEMLESPMYSAIYGSQASGGLIVITTKYGDEINYVTPLQPGLTLYNFKGYYKAKEFYAPKYMPDKKVSLADNRKTIYWQPTLLTDDGGEASFNYFNAGSPGKYRVVIEGIDSSGKIGRQVINYDVGVNN